MSLLRKIRSQLLTIANFRFTASRNTDAILAKLKVDIGLAHTEEKPSQLVTLGTGADGDVVSVSFALLCPAVTYAKVEGEKG